MTKTELTNNMIIENASETADKLKKWSAGKKIDRLDLSSIESIDLAGIQLLISAQITAEKKGLKYPYQGLLQKAVYEKLAGSGFTLAASDESDEYYAIRRNSSEF